MGLFPKASARLQGHIDAALATPLTRDEEGKLTIPQDNTMGVTGIGAIHVYDPEPENFNLGDQAPCEQCGLPRANQRHYTKDVIRDQVEVALAEQISSRDKAVDMCQTLGWTSLRLSVQIVNESARFVGINVHDAYDHGRTFVVIDYAGLRYPNGDDVAWLEGQDDRVGEPIDVSELDENVWLIAQPMDLEQDEERTYWFDLNIADVNNALTIPDE